MSQFSDLPLREPARAALTEMGTSSAFTRPTSKLLEGMNTPIVPFFINCHVEPTPTAHRIHAFGTALGEILEEMPGKVALLSVGGLSHDPNGDRAGWIDNRLDQWVLDRMAKGDVSRLKTLFDVDSDTTRGGTGQISETMIASIAAGKACALNERVGVSRAGSRFFTCTACWIHLAVATK